MKPFGEGPSSNSFCEVLNLTKFCNRGKCNNERNSVRDEEAYCPEMANSVVTLWVFLWKGWIISLVNAHLQFKAKSEDSRAGFWYSLKLGSMHSNLHSWFLPYTRVWLGKRASLLIILLTLHPLLEILFQFLHSFPWRRFGINLLPTYQMTCTQSCYFWKFLTI